MVVGSGFTVLRTKYFHHVLVDLWLWTLSHTDESGEGRPTEAQWTTELPHHPQIPETDSGRGQRTGDCPMNLEPESV